MNNFEYLQPKDLKDASSLFKKTAQQCLLFAGGTDVLGLMKDEIISPEKLVNLKSITGLNEIKFTPGTGLKIGALVSVTEIAEHPIIAEKYTILQQAAQEVASPQLRNVGTLGGNICQRPRCSYFRGDFDCLRKGGDMCFAVDGFNKYHGIVAGGPCYIVHPSDMAVALLALDAKVSIFSGKKSRVIPISDFFVLPEQDVTSENILQPGEIVHEVHIPAYSANVKTGYVKFTEREVWDFAVVSVGAVLQKDGSNIASGRVAFGGVAPVPWQDETINKGLTGISANPDSVTEVAQKSFTEAEPLPMNEYKVPLARNLVKQLLMQLSG